MMPKLLVFFILLPAVGLASRSLTIPIDNLKQFQVAIINVGGIPQTLTVHLDAGIGGEFPMSNGGGYPFTAIGLTYAFSCSGSKPHPNTFTHCETASTHKTIAADAGTSFTLDVYGSVSLKFVVDEDAGALQAQGLSFARGDNCATCSWLGEAVSINHNHPF